MSTEVDLPAVLQKIRDQAGKTRKGCQYTNEEKAILGKYKEEYRALTTHEDRDLLLRNKILVDIFNHWFRKEQVMPSPEEIVTRRKNICEWIRNNWRSKKTIRTAPTTRKSSRANIVWRHRREEVIEEIKKLHMDGGGTGEPSPDETFRLRMTAAKNVYVQLSEGEKLEIQKAVDQSGMDGNPPDIQKRRASKYATGVVDKWSSAQWKDMGLLTLTFYAYRGVDQRVYINVHDKMAKHAGRHKRSFIDTYENLIENIQVKLLDYVKLLLQSPADKTPTPPPANSGPNASQQPLATSNIQVPLQRNLGSPVKGRNNLEIETIEGFPCMPRVTDNSELKKEIVEDIMRTYLSMHYQLASGNKKKHVPFAHLSQHQQQFVHPKYAPLNFAFKDPHNMSKDNILAFCKHVQQRQEEHGVQDAFRFLKYYSGKEMIPAVYGTHEDEERAAAKAVRQRAARAAAKQFKEAKTRSVTEQQQDNNHNDPDNHLIPFQDRSTPNMSSAINKTGYQHAIDPCLLMSDYGSANGGNRVPDGRPVPESDGREESLSDGRQFGDGPGPSSIIVSDSDMQILINCGFATQAPIPINGPDDGPPKYQVDASAQAVLAQHEASAQKSSKPVARSPKKRGLNADMQAVEEGKTILRKSGRIQKGKESTNKRQTRGDRRRQ